MASTVLSRLNHLRHSLWSRAYQFVLRLKFGKAALSIHESARLTSECTVRAHSPQRPSICIGHSTIINGELLTFAHGGQITIGSFCFVGRNTFIWSASRIAVGDRVLISHGVNIFDNLTHPLSAAERHHQFLSLLTVGHPKELDLDEKDIVIEDDALICAGAFILRGVTIGRGAVVGAAAVVTKDVPAWTVVAGNPARVIRMLAPET